MIMLVACLVLAFFLILGLSFDSWKAEKEMVEIKKRLDTLEVHKDYYVNRYIGELRRKVAELEKERK